MSNNTTNQQFQQGSTFTAWEKSQEINPILSRLYANETKVKGLIGNMIKTRLSNDLSYINVEDIFQEVALICADTERIMRRFSRWNWEIEVVNQETGKPETITSIRGFKLLVIEVMRTEVRRKRKFKMVVSMYDKDGNCRINPKTKKTPMFDVASDLILTIQRTVSQTEYEAIQLFMQSYTILEISELLGTSAQWLLQKAFKKIKNVLSSDELDNFTLAYYFKQSAKGTLKI